MKKLTFLWVACCLPILLFSQFYKKEDPLDFHRLKDEVHILCFFVETKYDHWDYDEIDYYFEELLKSQEWIVDQADNYGIDLSFNNDYFIFNQEIVYIDDVRLDNSLTVLQKTMDEMNYKSFDEFLQRNSFDHKEKKIKLLFFIKNNGRSHAYNLNGPDAFDSAIIYCRSTSGLFTDQYVMSHELLHLFGAWDLYYGQSQSRESAARLKELYPYSIMINTWRHKESLEVDELTAWRIGWIEKEEDHFADFSPNRKNRDREKRVGRGKSWSFDMKKKKDKN
jgi:hypothetical protein